MTAGVRESRTEEGDALWDAEGGLAHGLPCGEELEVDSRVDQLTDDQAQELLVQHILSAQDPIKEFSLARDFIERERRLGSLRVVGAVALAVLVAALAAAWIGGVL